MAENAALIDCLKPWLEGNYQAEVHLLNNEIERLMRNEQILSSEYSSVSDDYFAARHEIEHLYQLIDALQAQYNRVLTELRNPPGSRNNPIDLTQ